jgi:hypothetical protein
MSNFYYGAVMNPDLVKYLSSVMRGDENKRSVADLSNAQPHGNLQYHDLVKDHFLVDTRFALGLDEVI